MRCTENARTRAASGRYSRIRKAIWDNAIRGWLTGKNSFFSLSANFSLTSYPTPNERLGQQLGKAANFIDLPTDVTNKGMEDNMA